MQEDVRKKEYRRALWRSSRGGFIVMLVFAAYTSLLTAAIGAGISARLHFDSMDGMHAMLAGMYLACHCFSFRARWMRREPWLREAYSQSERFRLHYLWGLVEGLIPVALFYLLTLASGLVGVQQPLGISFGTFCLQLLRSVLCFWGVYSFSVLIAATATRRVDMLVGVIGFQAVQSSITSGYIHTFLYKYVFGRVEPLHRYTILLGWINPGEVSNQVVDPYNYQVGQPVFWAVAASGILVCSLAARRVFLQKDLAAPPTPTKAWYFYPLLTTMWIFGKGLQAYRQVFWPYLFGSAVLAFAAWMLLHARHVKAAALRCSAALCAGLTLFGLFVIVFVYTDAFGYDSQPPALAQLEHIGYTIHRRDGGLTGLDDKGEPTTHVRGYLLGPLYGASGGHWGREEYNRRLEELASALHSLHLAMLRRQQAYLLPHTEQGGAYSLWVTYSLPKQEGQNLYEYTRSYTYILSYEDLLGILPLLEALGQPVPAPPGVME